jgi:hypothetical protein
MKRVKVIATALVLAVLAALAGRVAAQETNVSERTFLTFSSAVEMPGVTLQPGTYVFKLADTPSRNVVQVWDQDEKNMVGQWLFVQAERPEVTGENVIMFRETREGATPAVQFWYFPGERIGKEFVYPKDQAQRIAARTGQDVRIEGGIVEGPGIAGIQPESSTATADNTSQNAPASAQPSAAAGSLAGNRGVTGDADADVDRDAAGVSADAAVNTQDSQVGVSANAGVNAQDNQAGVQANADVDANRAVGTSGQAESQVARADELPRTASPLALTGLLGLLSLAGAAGIRAMRQ